MESSVVAEVDRPAEVKTKNRFTGKIIRVSLAGALVDIGTGQAAVIHVSQIVAPTPEPIKRVEDVLQPGQEIEVWIKKVKPDHVELTMIKPLDMEWRDIKKDMSVKGTVVRLETFGAFVEIGAERPGLVHISEMAHGYVRTPGDVVKEGDEIEAMVLDVNRRKKQIKLSMKALLPEPVKEEPVRIADVQREQQFGQPRGDRPAAPRRAKKVQTRRKNEGMNDSVELLANMDEPVKTEAEPTAMEIALRSAMEKAKERKQEDKARKAKVAVSQEQEELLSRTLENKARTA